MQEKKTLRLEWIDPATLCENPRNWRRHPPEQIAALDELLDEVGWAGALLFNERTGRLIDGHARRSTWIADHPGQPAPVLVGSWSEAQEKKILLSLDPLGAMATADDISLGSLIGEVSLEPGSLADMIDELRPATSASDVGPIAAEAKGVDPENSEKPTSVEGGPTSVEGHIAAESGVLDAKPAENGEISQGDSRLSTSSPSVPYEPQYKILVTCKDEMHQSDLLDRFDREGIECRALIG